MVQVELLQCEIVHSTNEDTAFGRTVQGGEPFSFMIVTTWHRVPEEDFIGIVYLEQDPYGQRVALSEGSRAASCSIWPLKSQLEDDRMPPVTSSNGGCALRLPLPVNPRPETSPPPSYRSVASSNSSHGGAPIGTQAPPSCRGVAPSDGSRAYTPSQLSSRASTHSDSFRAQPRELEQATFVFHNVKIQNKHGIFQLKFEVYQKSERGGLEFLEYALLPRNPRVAPQGWDLVASSQHPQSDRKWRLLVPRPYSGSVNRMNAPC
ncbi:hypothetical protein QBC35DRAFT_498517 [Podospora australis]|uniref:Uncharacterized protein n=1 Tax=Podospora australis TaxID=1536484 RepID=A0AAN6WSU3_9PEZI|nr:hypothetical protein QBC35DRAFT_498517 [Podospora australis]